MVNEILHVLGENLGSLLSAVVGIILVQRGIPRR